MDAMTVDEVVGRLKAHEERMRGQTDNEGGQLLLTQEEWSKRFNKNDGISSGQRGRGTCSYRGRGRGLTRSVNSGRGQQGRGEEKARGHTPNRDNKNTKD